MRWIIHAFLGGISLYIYKDYLFLSLITISFHCSLTDVLLDFYGTIFLNILNNSSGHIISHKNSFCNLSYCTASETTLLFWWHHQAIIFQLLFSNHTLYSGSWRQHFFITIHLFSSNILFHFEMGHVVKGNGLWMAFHTDFMSLDLTGIFCWDIINLVP